MHFGFILSLIIFPIGTEFPNCSPPHFPQVRLGFVPPTRAVCGTRRYFHSVHSRHTTMLIVIASVTRQFSHCELRQCLASLVVHKTLLNINHPHARRCASWTSCSSVSPRRSSPTYPSLTVYSQEHRISYYYLYSSGFLHIILCWLA